MGRLSKKQEAFLEAYKAKGMNVSEACKAVSIDRTTYYRWCNKNNTFVRKRDEAIETLYDFTESKLIKQIKNDNLRAIIFFCETRMRDRGYYKRQELDHGGGVPVTQVEWQVVDTKKSNNSDNSTR